MYGAHHRVAQLRRGAPAAEKHSAAAATAFCDSFGATPVGTQHDPHTQRSAQLRIPPAGVVACGYAPPATLRRSRLATPSTAEPPRSSQLSMPAAGLMTSAPTQAAPQCRDTAAALLSLVQCMQQQEKHMTAGLNNLSQLPVLVDVQQAQVTAINGLTAEVRAMAAVMRDAVAVLQGPHNAEMYVTAGNPSCHGSSLLKQTAHGGATADNNNNNNNNSTCALVLGTDSPSTTPQMAEGEEEGGGAAYICHSQLRHVRLRGTEGTAVRARSELIEDDVFSM